MKDEMKMRTVLDYTTWDLNIPWMYKPKWRKKLSTILKRGARRTMKQELQKELSK